MPNTQGALSNQVTNVNLMSNLKFAFRIQRYPGINYFIQRVNLPGVSFPVTIRPTPFTDVPIEGDHLVYEPLQVTFLVDEDLKNWNDMYTWMTGITFPRSFDEFRELKNQNIVISPDYGNIYSDVTLTILTNKSNPIANIFFRNAFPTVLTPIEFDTTNTDVSPITSTVTFRYTYYDVETLA